MKAEFPYPYYLVLSYNFKTTKSTNYQARLT